MSRTTSRGTTFTVEERRGDRVVMMSNPARPGEVEAGRIVDVDGVKGFRPSAIMPGALSADGLRVIADLVEEGA
ncbi:hypothetical protein NYP18_09040 [Corynebacterium sp. YIM 101645]|uniref:Uncharacterized protein n=1 Tax=Corynebacterium lemuris TaxID=1859292 RepID=A0ABT2FX37_9CORY|nr:hypothetical protein [Corynebacterium lemuris]MCS5479804.1 hypothetical protein [Corynebacterium lemuris]